MHFGKQPNNVGTKNNAEMHFSEQPNNVGKINKIKQGKQIWQTRYTCTTPSFSGRMII